MKLIVASLLLLQLPSTSDDRLADSIRHYVQTRLEGRFDSMSSGRPVTLLSGDRTGLLYEVDVCRVVIDTRLTPWQHKKQFKTFWVLVIDGRPVRHQATGLSLKQLKICKPPG